MRLAKDTKRETGMETQEQVRGEEQMRSKRASRKNAFRKNKTDPSPSQIAALFALFQRIKIPAR